MLRLTPFFACLTAITLAIGCQTGGEGSEQPEEAEIRTIGTIERLDPALDELVPGDAEIEILAEGFDWTEGPVWIPEDGGYLLYSEIPSNSVYKWQDGQNSLWLRPSGYTGEEERGGEPGSNGLLLNENGDLVMCQHGDRRMARYTGSMSDPSPSFETIASHYDGKRFNSPNDAVYHSSGDLYFTDPPYGLVGNVNDPTKEIPFQGVYRATPDGQVTLLTDQMTRPNGIAFSPDEKTLYVANSDPNQTLWMAFDVLDDGSVENGRVFFDATYMRQQGRKGSADGLKVDKNGNLFATGPGGVLIFTPEGKHLGTISTTEATSNCAFGDDGSTLYMTADMYLLRVKLSTTGDGF